jgi:hypothetical protein
MKDKELEQSKNSKLFNRITFSLTGLFTFVSTFYFGFSKQPTEMGIAVLTGSIIMAFTNIDRLKSFKGAGFEAVMNNAVENAYATADSMKKLGKILVSSILPILTYEGRMSGISVNQKFELKKQLDLVSKDLFISDNNIKIANKELSEMILRESIEDIEHAIEYGDEIKKELKNNLLVKLRSSKPFLKSTEIKELLKDCIQVDSKLADKVEILQIVENYIKKHS